MLFILLGFISGNPLYRQLYQQDDCCLARARVVRKAWAGHYAKRTLRRLMRNIPARAPSPKPRRKPRAKSPPIALLHPESEPEPQSQAEALLHEIQKYAQHAVGSYVPSTHLQRFYGEMCDQKGWERKHWCVICQTLGKLTERVFNKRGSKRLMAYKIPRACT